MIVTFNSARPVKKLRTQGAVPQIPTTATKIIKINAVSNHYAYVQHLKATTNKENKTKRTKHTCTHTHTHTLSLSLSVSQTQLIHPTSQTEESYQDDFSKSS